MKDFYLYWFKYILICLFWFGYACLASMSAVWLLIESYMGISGSNTSPLSYCCFLTLSILVGFFWFIIYGNYLSGFLRKKIEIKSNVPNTTIIIKFGNIFKHENIIAVGVNDFFDSVVDGYVISGESLHGQMLSKYWASNTVDWDKQVASELSEQPSQHVNRSHGKEIRYQIGTTAETRTHDGKRFLCVALSKTDDKTQETTASSTDLIIAIRGMLKKARSVCGDKPLFIPLMGAGLSRTDLKSIVLLNLIIAAIFEENRKGRITRTICIVLPWDKLPEINLSTIKKSWS